MREIEDWIRFSWRWPARGAAVPVDFRLSDSTRARVGHPNILGVIYLLLSSGVMLIAAHIVGAFT